MLQKCYTELLNINYITVRILSFLLTNFFYGWPVVKITPITLIFKVDFKILTTELTVYSPHYPFKEQTKQSNVEYVEML